MLQIIKSGKKEVCVDNQHTGEVMFIKNIVSVEQLNDIVKIKYVDTLVYNLRDKMISIYYYTD